MDLFQSLPSFLQFICCDDQFYVGDYNDDLVDFYKPSSNQLFSIFIFHFYRWQQSLLPVNDGSLSESEKRDEYFLRDIADNLRPRINSASLRNDTIFRDFCHFHLTFWDENRTQ